MFDRLLSYYSHALSDGNLPAEHKLTLNFPDQSQIILDKSQLSSEETALLKALFDGEESPLLPVSYHDRFVFEWLIEERNVNTEELINIFSPPVRLIHFNVYGELGEKEGFSEALQGLFPVTKSLLWKSPTEGILIQQIDAEFEEELSIKSIIDTITTDFFIKISFYIGSPITDLPLLKERYEWEKSIYNSVRADFPKKNYFYEQEILIYYLLHNLPGASTEKMKKMLAPVQDDQELIDTVKTYLECNLNTTLAAKKMFMHRNTLQYRVDKFIEKTSIDIKQFPNAVAVYVILAAIDPH
ncbi:PucR family transcriptional regulator [Salipaludibacillus aurantiacus]|uniref:DNA-binding transcriptional regulator, PucR family n=1 Tax=Salipaludibacillus aurantiacus TaxID=1601833 RepID=A0A1H9RP94_9BACI|nr:helix-turn-helix domain-containing protein [Salipaludibacillus aurantiacus]SER74295.1 DNA-binding transcriptional regulator, PucR family [Salipaludibacillus aurantiacus]